LSRPFPSRPYFSREPLHRRNGKIRAREVRVLDENKQQLGVMTLHEALRIAMSKGLDLVEIAPNATPSVCRIVDYGKFMYEEAKRHKDSQSKQSASRMKEIQLSPTIDPHDFSIKLSRAIDFLCDDMKVRIKLRFRGRQKAHTEFGFQVVNRFVKETAAWGQADAPPKMLGDRDLNAVISPLPRNKRAKNPHQTETPKAQEPPDAPEPPDMPESPESTESPESVS